MAESLLLPMPVDCHTHVRRGEIMPKVLRQTARQFGAGLIMPNTQPGIFTGEDLTAYKSEILSSLDGEQFTPWMTVKLKNDTTVEMMQAAHAAGAIAAKLYPRGVTTNSEDGVDIEDIDRLFPVFNYMRRQRMLLLLHGEHPSAYYADAESAFLDVLEHIHYQFPRLHIVLEHVSTAEAVRMVRKLGPTVAATITVHHMLLTGDDVAKGKFRPEYYCLPMAKRPSDRDAVLAAALSGNPKFFLGTDSAPHLPAGKLCWECCGGIYMGPYALDYVATIFDQHRSLKQMPDFVAGFGYKHYEMNPLPGQVKLMRADWEPDEFYDGVKAFRHKDCKTLRYRFYCKLL